MFQTAFYTNIGCFTPIYIPKSARLQHLLQAILSNIFLKAPDMKKLLLITLILIPFTASADTEARIATLESRISYLEKRLELLEKNNKQNIVIEHRRAKNPVYICSISMFGKTYEAGEHNEGLARISARKACEKEQDGFFCRDERAKCKKFD